MLLQAEGGWHGEIIINDGCSKLEPKQIRQKMDSGECVRGVCVCAFETAALLHACM